MEEEKKETSKKKEEKKNTVLEVQDGVLGSEVK